MLVFYDTLRIKRRISPAFCGCQGSFYMHFAGRITNFICILRVSRFIVTAIYNTLKLRKCILLAFCIPYGIIYSILWTLRTPLSYSISREAEKVLGSIKFTQGIYIKIPGLRNPEKPRNAYGGPGKPRDAQESPGKPREAEGSPGRQTHKRPNG